MTTADLVTMFKKQPVGISCALVCIVCAALIYYRSDKIDEAMDLNEKKSAEAARILANVRNLDKLPEHVAEIQNLTKELGSRLVHPGQLADNQQYFYKLEAETEVKLIQMTQGAVAPGKTKAQFIGVPFVVSVQGTFHQVLTFLYRLQNGPRFCRILSASFTKLSGGGESNAVVNSASMSVALNIELLGQP